MSLESILTLSAIIIGPLLAVLVTRINDQRRESRQRKLNIYRVLMATRGARLNFVHIESLNSIDVEFSGTKYKKTKEAWKAYQSHLSDKNFPKEQWPVHALVLFVDLLSAMGASLGYDFDKTHLKNGAYNPEYYGDLENDQFKIREGIKAVLSGERSVSINVVNVPLLDDIAEDDKKIDEK